MVYDLVTATTSTHSIRCENTYGRIRQHGRTCVPPADLNKRRRSAPLATERQRRLTAFDRHPPVRETDVTGHGLQRRVVVIPEDVKRHEDDDGQARADKGAFAQRVADQRGYESEGGQ